MPRSSISFLAAELHILSDVEYLHEVRRRFELHDLCYKKWTLLYTIPFDDPTSIDSGSVCTFASLIYPGRKVWPVGGSCNFETTITSYLAQCWANLLDLTSNIRCLLATALQDLKQLRLKRDRLTVFIPFRRSSIHIP